MLALRREVSFHACFELSLSPPLLLPSLPASVVPSAYTRDPLLRLPVAIRHTTPPRARHITASSIELAASCPTASPRMFIRL